MNACLVLTYIELLTKSSDATTNSTSFSNMTVFAVFKTVVFLVTTVFLLTLSGVASQKYIAVYCVALYFPAVKKKKKTKMVDWS